MFWGSFHLWIQTSLLLLLGQLHFLFCYISQHMTALNLISVNARGLNIPHKITTVLEFLHKKNLDFAIIQESHLLCKDAGL